VDANSLESLLVKIMMACGLYADGSSKRRACWDEDQGDKASIHGVKKWSLTFRSKYSWPCYAVNCRYLRLKLSCSASLMAKAI